MDDSEGSDLDGQELSEGRDQAVVQALASLSKEAELKQDIECLQECQPSALTVEPPDTESSHVQVVEDTEKAKATPSVQPATNMSCEHHGTQTLAEMLAMLGFDKFQPPDLDSIDEAQKNDTGSKKCPDSVVIITNLQAVKLYLYHHISMIASFNRHLTCLQCLLIHWGFLMACLCQAEHSCSFVMISPAPARP
jgi:hypothetical protein